MAREELIAALTGLGDMERLIGRIVYGTAGDGTWCPSAPPSSGCRPPGPAGGLLRRTAGGAGRGAGRPDGDRAHIGAAICDEPPFSVREGGFIRDGYHEEVDRLRHIMNGGKGRPGGDRGQGEGAHRHPDPEDRLQQGLRLLHRGVQLLQGPGAGHLHPQADPGERGSGTSPRS